MTSHCIHILCNVILELFSKREYIPYHKKFILPSGIWWKWWWATSKPRHQETLSASIWFLDFWEHSQSFCWSRVMDGRYMEQNCVTWSSAQMRSLHEPRLHQLNDLNIRKKILIVICQNMLSFYTAKITNSIILCYSPQILKWGTEARKN